jgi:hypothetical protein
LFLEGVEMVLEDLEIDLGKYFSLGGQSRDKSQMSGETSINEEGTRFGVHGTEEHSSLNESLLFKGISVIYKLVINNLSDQRDRCLGKIFIFLGHVKIIQEVDQNFTNGWSIVSTSLLANLGFK